MAAKWLSTLKPLTPEVEKYIKDNYHKVVSRQVSQKEMARHLKMSPSLLGGYAQLYGLTRNSQKAG